MTASGCIRHFVVSRMWTRDVDNRFVDWTRPPYYDEATGRLTLVLPGEDIHTEAFQEAHYQRIIEYTRLRRREMARAREKRRRSGLSAREQARLAVGLDR